MFPNSKMKFKGCSIFEKIRLPIHIFLDSRRQKRRPYLSLTFTGLRTIVHLLLMYYQTCLQKYDLFIVEFWMKEILNMKRLIKTYISTLLNLSKQSSSRIPRSNQISRGERYVGSARLSCDKIRSNDRPGGCN